MLILSISVIVALCFLIVMFSNPFKTKLEHFLQNELGRHRKEGVYVYRYDNGNSFFYEFPYGITGVFYNKSVYIYDNIPVTMCASQSYDSVFEVINGLFVSKCFLAKHLLRDIFKNAPITDYLNTEKLDPKLDFTERATKIISMVQSLNE